MCTNKTTKKNKARCKNKWSKAKIKLDGITKTIAIYLCIVQPYHIRDRNILLHCMKPKHQQVGVNPISSNYTILLKIYGCLSCDI